MSIQGVEVGRGVRVPPGIYKIEFYDGGVTYGSIGTNNVGEAWFAPYNWIVVPSYEWSEVKSVTPIVLPDAATTRNRRWDLIKAVAESAGDTLTEFEAATMVASLVREMAEVHRG